MSASYIRRPPKAKVGYQGSVNVTLQRQLKREKSPQFLNKKWLTHKETDRSHVVGWHTTYWKHIAIN